MIQNNVRLQQNVTLSQPDTQVRVHAPGGKMETLVLDGKVDDFVASQNSNFPMKDLQDLHELLNSKAFKTLSARVAARKDDNWMFHAPADAQNGAYTTLTISPGRKSTEVKWGGQTARLEGKNVELISRIPFAQGNSSVTHIIRGENTPDGPVYTEESYQFISGRELWDTVARTLE